MAPEFQDPADVARRLVASFAEQIGRADAVLVADAWWDDFQPVRDIARASVRVTVVRGDDGVVATVPHVAGAVLYVACGVVTGRTAAAVARAAQASGAETVGLVAGVVPRDTRSALSSVIADVGAVLTPLVHRDLRWHVASFS